MVSNVATTSPHAAGMATGEASSNSVLLDAAITINGSATRAAARTGGSTAFDPRPACHFENGPWVLPLPPGLPNPEGELVHPIGFGDGRRGSLDANERPGRRVDPLQPEPEPLPIPSLDELRAGAETIEQKVHVLQGRLEVIRSAVRRGDVDRSAAAFGDARHAFRDLVRLANRLQINIGDGDPTSPESLAKARIGAAVTDAYQLANQIEDAMPGDAHV